MQLATDEWEMAFRLIAALLAGSLVGYERSYRGRPAGFRTHALVCVASSLLMLVTVYEAYWVQTEVDAVRIDPTRMAQGIMTGIGFLGAGVIIKEGLSVRGLTTAASIWFTAAIGILAGIGFYFPLALSVVIAILVLAVFRWIESHMPARSYYSFDVRFARGSEMKEDALRELIAAHGFSAASFSYRLDREGRVLRHDMVLSSVVKSSARSLAETLEATDTVLEFRISPIGE